VSFGFAELSRDFRDSQELTVRNNGSSPITFNVAVTPATGAPHTATVSQATLQVPAGGAANVLVRLAVPAATVGDATDFREVSGFVTFTPATPTANGGVTLTVPYYLVPRALSDVRAEARAFGPSRESSSVTIRNPNGVIAGNADFYAWGLESRPQGLAFFDPRAVGVQAFPDVADSQLVFAVNTHGRFSNAAAGEFDVLLDTDGDGVADFDVVGADLGAVTAGDNNGILVSFVIDLKTGVIVDAFNTDAPTDGSTVLLPFLASDVGLSPANPRFTYSATLFDLDGTAADVPGTASFNAFSPAISTGQFVSVDPGARATVPVSVDPAEWALTPALGLMVVTEDNAAGKAEAALLEADTRTPRGGAGLARR
jgi:minor extracellular serine protease Vpr